ncbi:hypothetical protein C8J57DRAFT_1270838 [Mycena rebaudengoi]|nr:hypothetical protein C8J57DRAFT_1270838 [Mycena rebaudengoi]
MVQCSALAAVAGLRPEFDARGCCGGKCGIPFIKKPKMVQCSALAAVAGLRPEFDARGCCGGKCGIPFTKKPKMVQCSALAAVAGLRPEFDARGCCGWQCGIPGRRGGCLYEGKWVENGKEKLTFSKKCQKWHSARCWRRWRRRGAASGIRRPRLLRMAMRDAFSKKAQNGSVLGVGGGTFGIRRPRRLRGRCGVPFTKKPKIVQCSALAAAAGVHPEFDVRVAWGPMRGTSFQKCPRWRSRLAMTPSARSAFGAQGTWGAMR